MITLSIIVLYIYNQCLFVHISRRNYGFKHLEIREFIEIVGFKVSSNISGKVVLLNLENTGGLPVTYGSGGTRICIRDHKN